ncbi:MAG TPA: DNA polymerase III subunit beta [Candidatus Paceibacterota bacterium]|nr:DNA polymerase III subunit beta [Candidatus Paceibacterota bacterium]
MIIKVDKKEIAQAVSTVARFAERRSATLPVLSGIAIVAGDDGIKLRATNLETGIDYKVSGEIKTPGVVALPASTLREITSSFTGTGTVTLEHGGDTVVITSELGRSTLKTLPFEDFPSLPFPESPKAKFSLPGASLRALITTVAPCASPSTVRPELASVLLTCESGTLKAVATDSFRLAEKKLSVEGKVGAFSMLIPAKNALDIVQTIPDDAIEVLIDEHQCAFSWPSGIVTTRLVTLSYPDYTQIIPKSFVSEATLLRKDLESGLKRTAIFSDTFQKVRLAMGTNEKKLTLTARNNDVGETSESIPASVTGESIELSFNHRYLSAPLSSISAESLTLSASGIGRPLVMRGTGDTSFLYLVMPMNQ